MATDGSQKTNVTGGIGDSTDASFSPDGQRIVFSGDQAELAYSNIYFIPVKGGVPVRLTHNDTGYDGAPSWSPDGRWIAFESCVGEPDGTAGTGIWIIEADRK